MFIDVCRANDADHTDRRVRLSRSTIDDTLARLRSELRVPLFRQIKHELGRRPGTRPICMRTRTVLKRSLALRRCRGCRTKRVRVNTDAAVNGCMLPPLLTGLCRTLPSTGISICVTGARRIIDRIRRLGVSVTIIRNVPHPASVGIVRRQR